MGTPNENNKENFVGTFVETSFNGEDIKATIQSERNKGIQEAPCAFLDSGDADR
ncbi:hypothetical protein [Methylotenera sp.]|uniref:hypothetical protein n=1 Tax=Methylotenera sp. TaxID=2051956 RepID=UPI002ED806DC